jgi:hypothetical protein
MRSDVGKVVKRTIFTSSIILPKLYQRHASTATHPHPTDWWDCRGVGNGSSINCLGRRVTSYTTRDAKEIAKLPAMLP